MVMLRGGNIILLTFKHKEDLISEDRNTLRMYKE